MKDNRLHCVYNFLGSQEQSVRAMRDLPTGRDLILAASFDKDGEGPPGAAHGILSLYYGHEKAGGGRIRTQPGKFSIADEGLNIGRHNAEAVTDDYPGARPGTSPAGRCACWPST